ncbi:phosphoglycerate dehydrogenase [Rothia kristinae]|uniref:Phosphoglycerate dehydrogenase n=1 Tax=Rothia kristinae TaxID=37923 RepID=A0A199NSF2_9MICC|nr:phosphoglycerate dehydrogenase [Rothia kristinae]OAX51631.1 phosphoglycerate dehydrogenase [Rothia kristinae]OAX57043.1 phosphoglycerate dehydrogenase [Rothia kristinae]
MKILLPMSIELDAQTLPLEPGDVVADYDPTQPVREEDADAEVMVVWGNTDDQLADAAQRLTDLKLIQALLAGPDQIKKAGFGEDVVVCAGIGLHDRTVSEHALALSLSLVRFLPELARRQERREWASELGGAQPLHPEGAPITTLLDARVTIWGFGSIGQTLAPLFTALGAKVSGIARSTGERAGYPVVATEEKNELLARTDLLVMILPSGEATADSLDAAVLKTLPDTAYVVNVGRGSTVDEAALIEALEEGRIAGAAIDVAKTEPLPAEDPLWGAPHLIITPHAAGGRPGGAEELIGHNLKALRGDGEFRNRM